MKLSLKMYKKVFLKVVQEGKAGIFLFFFSLLFIANGSFAKPSKTPTLKEGDVVDYQKCQVNRSACICGPGLLPQTFLGPKGVRYYQCLRAHCGPGEKVIISRSAGGKRSTTCKKIEVNEYAEPKVIKRPVSAGKNKKGGA